MHEPFCLAYLKGKCIDQRDRKESTLAILCVEALKEEKRDCEEVHSRNFVYPLLNIIEDKVPMGVATSLVVNHVNSGVLYLFELCLCLCVWLSNISRKYLKHLKGLDYS